MLSFFVFLFLGILTNLMSFMGLAFSAPTTETQNNPALAKLIVIYTGVADLLVNIHYIAMPFYFLLTVGLFFWKSRELGLSLAKWSLALPAFSFLCLFLYYAIAAKLGD